MAAAGSGARIRQANLGWVRAGVYWKTTETSRGIFDYTEADNLVLDARQNGLSVIFILSGSPQWATPGSANTNGAYPPTDITLWTEYVQALSAHFASPSLVAQCGGRCVEAYEVWNEPDTSGSGTVGVGWDRDITEAPTYTDYFVAASRIIHANSPGTLVGGPALTGDSRSRVQTIFTQLESTVYYDGPASSFVDFISVHKNQLDYLLPNSALDDLYVNDLSYLRDYNPSNAEKPIYITEFGWDSSTVGEGTQAYDIIQFLSYAAGNYYDWLAPFNIVHADIYCLDCGGQGIFRADGTPKQVVTSYLQQLQFPATQTPALDDPAFTIVTFRTYYGYYLTATAGGGYDLNARDLTARSWQDFTIVHQGTPLQSGDLINLRTLGAYYVVAEDGGNSVVNANSRNASTWETFTIIKVGGSGPISSGDSVALQSTNGYYVVAEGGGGGVVNANRTAIGPWETFTLVDSTPR